MATSDSWTVWSQTAITCSNFIANFEHIPHICSLVSINNFEQVNAGGYTK